MSSERAKSPTGGADFRRVMEKRPLNSISVEYVVRRENMLQAWSQVRGNKGAPGIDGITIEEFPEFAKANWEGIKSSLEEGSYVPSPVKRVEIPKDKGGVRKLGIPIVMDRVMQQAISQVLSPVFDPHFSESSFGFRPGRSAHQAVQKVVNDIQRGYAWAVDIDPRLRGDRLLRSSSIR
jgi:RNA-directed DNA polymerase